MADLGEQAAAAVRQAMAGAAGYLALVTRVNPLGSADVLLERPDTDAVLRQALDAAREGAEGLVWQAWYSSGAEDPDDETLNHLLADTGRIFGALARLRDLVRRAHDSVPPARFTPGVTVPGEHPSQRAAEERAGAVQAAVLGWAREAALRSRMAAGLAAAAGLNSAALGAALHREAAGERLAKRWRARAESPTCCLWCRRLNGVTIGLRESFLPYLGGPVTMPQSRERHVATPGGARRYGLPVGEKITYTHPPRPYHGKLQGPLLHPGCRCRLEIVRAGDVAGIPQESDPAGGTFLSADDVRGMTEDDYQADLAFLQAAVYELDRVLKRLAGGGG